MKSRWACPAWRRGKEDGGARRRWGAAGSEADGELALGSIDASPPQSFSSVGEMLLSTVLLPPRHRAAVAQPCLNEAGRGSLPLCLWLCLLPLCSGPQMKGDTSTCTEQAVAPVSLSTENRGK